MAEGSNTLKNAGWALLIIVVIIIGVVIDYQGNNYELTYKTVDIAVGKNKTDHKTVITTPAITQGYKLLATFFYGLAVTLFVSIFIARKLEQDQKEKHKKELENLRSAVNINVFDALFKTLIPEEIFKIVKTEIIENKAIRKKAHWTFVFEEVEEKIKMTATTHYELHNVSKEPVQDPVNISIDPLSSIDLEVISAKCLSSDGTTLVEFDPSKDDCNRNIIIKELDNGAQRISYTVSVPSNDYID